MSETEKKTDQRVAIAAGAATAGGGLGLVGTLLASGHGQKLLDALTTTGPVALLMLAVLVLILRDRERVLRERDHERDLRERDRDRYEAKQEANLREVIDLTYSLRDAFKAAVDLPAPPDAGPVEVPGDS